MLFCASCDRPLVGKGAFLPPPESDFVCLSCFVKKVGRQPAPPAHLTESQVRTFAGFPQHRKTPHPPNYSTPYQVDLQHAIAQQVRKKVAKRNVLTLMNLPPGTYSG